MLRHHLQKRASQISSRQVNPLTTTVHDQFHRPHNRQRNTSTSTAPTSNPLNGTISIITGASRGIGQAIATRFAKNGSQCLLIGRDEKALKQTQTQCNEASSSSAAQLTHALKVGDISSRSFWTSLNLQDDLLFPSSGNNDNNRESVKAQPTILVNAAGVTHSSLLLRTSASQIESVIQTNLMGTLWASQILGKTMLRQKTGGVIINIASLLATHGGAGSAAYVASKAGVVGLTRSLAAELGAAGVRVNAVLPGYIESDMTKAMSSKAREEALSKIPVGRFGTVDEIAEAAVFLATNAYANNCVINLDGGLSAM